MIDFQKAYEKLKEIYGLKAIRFGISDVSGAFSESECQTLRNASGSSGVYLGRLPAGLGILSAMVKNYERLDEEGFASEYVSRHLSDMNKEGGTERYTIFGTELKTDRRTHRDYVLPSLVSDELRRNARDFYVASDKSRIEGVSGLKGVTLYEMRHACEIAEADLRNGDLIVISTDQQAIKNMERNLKQRLLA